MYDECLCLNYEGKVKDLRSSFANNINDSVNDNDNDIGNFNDTNDQW